MARLIFTLLLLVTGVSVGSAQDGSDPTATLEEQTRRRRQEELARIGRLQELNGLQLRQKLRRFDRRLKTSGNGFPRPERHNQGLHQVRQQETARQSHLRQSLDRLELGARQGDARQKQELTRLQHRQRAEAFLDQQGIRLRRNRLRGR